MCGIFGLITPGKPIPVAACFDAIQALTHRGPDGLGITLARTADAASDFFLNPDCGVVQAAGGRSTDIFLGHRRLSVIDLATLAFQPMANETGQIWVVFNGEIYNYQELRKTLQGRGHDFQTDHSDTEVLVHGYEEWGEKLVDHLQGMFAFAIVDLKAGKAFFARDRFGEKPLYLAPFNGGWVFASELKALLAGGFADKKISPDAVTDFLRFGFVPAPGTIYRGVTKLMAAETAVMNFSEPAELHRARYWELSYEPEPVRDERAWAEEFDHEVAKSVGLRMLSDVPLGAFLSGGLDSTNVVRQLARQSSSAPRTFNIGFAEQAFDESAFAQEAARAYRTDHSTRTISPGDLLGLMPDHARIFDEPFADSSALPTLAVARMAREKVTVCLSGDGGDELLAGYARYRMNHSLGSFFDHLPGKLLSGLLRPLIGLWPERRRGYGLISLFRSGGQERYRRMMSDDWLSRRTTLATGEGQFDYDSVWDSRAPCLIDRMCKADVEFYIPEDLMVKVDRTSMDVALEARAPFLDHKLFEFVARSPLEYRFDGNVGKLPFRRSLAADLGAPFVERPKQGFAVPLGQWFRKELRSMLEDLIAPKDSFVSSLFAPGTVPALIRDHQDGSRDQSHRLWKLLVLELWQRRYGGTL